MDDTLKFSDFLKILEKNEADLDDLGNGEEIEEDFDETETDSVEETEETPEETEEVEDTVDLEDMSISRTRSYMKLINNFLAGIKSMVDNAEDEPLDDATKEKVLKIYKIIQGIK